jgi:hypothetical protein
VAVEEAERASLTCPPVFALLDRRIYGDTQVLIARKLQAIVHADDQGHARNR